MAVLSFLLRTSARHRWRSWLLLGLLIALVSGLVLAAATAGRRTSSAFPQYEAAHGYDGFLYGISPIPKISTLSEVTSAQLVQLPEGGSPTCSCSRPINNNNFSLFEAAPQNLSHMVKLVSGSMPDQSDPNQVLASFTLQRDDGVHIGTVIRVPLFAASQRKAVLNSATAPTPNGPTVSLRVVGIEAAELDFPTASAPSYDLFTTEAFAKSFNAKSVVLSAYFVRLRHGAADLPRFQSQAKALGGLSVSDLDTSASAIVGSIQPLAVGWWILAGLAALVGIIVMAQALARQATIEADSYATLSALGVSRRQLVVLTMTRTLFIGVVGAIGGMVLAFLLSPLTLVGEAKLAAPSTGFDFDTLALLLGALAAIIAVLALGLWPAIRTARMKNPGESTRVARPSRIVALLTALDAPVSALMGVRHALERGRGDNAVPVGSAMLGSILAVTALCATVVFGASLTHLTSTPTLYGQLSGLSFSVNGSLSSTWNEQMLTGIERTRAVSDIFAAVSGDVSINGKDVDAIAGQSLRGQLVVTMINGRLPSAGNEVTLGATTLRQLGAHVGSVVRVAVPQPQGGSHISSFRIVGTAVFPPNGVGGLGTGALFTLDSFLGGRCNPGPKQNACFVQSVIAAQGAFVVRAAPGAQGQAALTRLSRAYPSEVTHPATPTNLVNFGEAVDFPLIFGLVVILFGTATLMHFLVVSVVRRRREAGLLKSLGFIRRQVAFAVSWQTTTVAVVGIIIGVPVGIAIGREVWRAFANNLGVLPIPVVTVWVMVAVASGTLIVANVLAIGPALVASRSNPASLLKAE